MFISICSSSFTYLSYSCNSFNFDSFSIFDWCLICFMNSISRFRFYYIFSYSSYLTLEAINLFWCIDCSNSYSIWLLHCCCFDLSVIPSIAFLLDMSILTRLTPGSSSLALSSCTLIFLTSFSTYSCTWCSILFALISSLRCLLEMTVVLASSSLETRECDLLSWRCRVEMRLFNSWIFSCCSRI